MPSERSMIVSSQLHLVVLAPLLAIAAASDVGRRKIPNWLTVTVAVTGAAAQAFAGGPRAVGDALLAAIVVLALGIVFWAKRMLGGGDVKLAAAAATWVGLSRSPRYLIASALAGGLVATVCYLLSSSDRRFSIRANLYRLHAPQLPADVQSTSGVVLVPYGVAFAAGALFALYS